MGNIFSSKSSEEERELAKRGVLIPPSFGVGTSSALPPSSSRQHHLHPFDRVVAQLPCNRLLQEHMTPGIWISAAAPTESSVLASFVPQPTAGSYEGMMYASQSVGEKGEIHLRAHTEVSPSVLACYRALPNCLVKGTVDVASGHGFLGFHYNTTIISPSAKNGDTEYYRNDPFVQQAAEPTNNNTNTMIQVASWVKFQPRTKDMVQSVTGFGALESKGYKAAVKATVPFKQQQQQEPQLSYMASFDLNSEGPPLTVTLEQSPTTGASMGLSQVVTFDRWVANLLEDRCPKIRNTLGWSVRMTQMKDKSTLSAGTAWQINRGLAVKLVASPEQGVTAGILLKRWKEPRVTCCLMFGGGGQSFGFKGIGVEIETGVSQSSSSADDLYYGGDGRTQVSGDAPVTKATLPTEKEMGNG